MLYFISLNKLFINKSKAYKVCDCMKKKVLFVSAIILCLIIAITYLFIPIKAKESITLPAIIICGENLQVENTNLTIDGTWTRSMITSPRQSFAGKIQVEMLDYTHKEDGWDLNFQVSDEASINYLSGGFFYNSSSNLPGYGWLYTDKEHDHYVLVTTHFNNQSDDYIVIAPAETEEEAKHICNIMGLSYLQN